MILVMLILQNWQQSILLAAFRTLSLQSHLSVKAPELGNPFLYRPLPSISMISPTKKIRRNMPHPHFQTVFKQKVVILIVVSLTLEIVEFLENK